MSNKFVIKPTSAASSSPEVVAAPSSGGEACDDDFWADPATMQSVDHNFHIFEVRSQPQEKTVSVEMPSERYKMLCGSVVARGNTLVLGSYPENEKKWVAVHDPARPSAYIILKVLALVEPDEAHPMYETEVKRLEISSLTSSEGMSDLVSANNWGNLDPNKLVKYAGNHAALLCPIPTRYTLCGGGFYATVPVFRSAPQTAEAMKAADPTAEPTSPSGPGGGGWIVEANRHKSIVSFSVGIRLRRGARRGKAAPPPTVNSPATTPQATQQSDDAIRISLEGPHWSGSFPEPHGDVTFYLGSCQRQDPATTALFVVPDPRFKVDISKAPPSFWPLYHTPFNKVELKKSNYKYCRNTKSYSPH